ncbi:D-alanyl-D-alanine endopeptidase (penicillin-binding protein 7) [Formivibrio citricus]|uniref:D-alanyl-D-alanine endopeptidase (Penicillin-binding protein 7) n=1 Tax=Formivibrio citricus TaxID=83765 RepID=A0A1I5BVD7_9NEIS|nr:D-alanyl-D-alanine endopeptidase [Formivibrio citricus]SFN78726.1 D-alanyl-D-alanine endopeptidase (penicillin-binding protein 7) [Formivibrio citricus]
MRNPMIYLCSIATAVMLLTSTATSAATTAKQQKTVKTSSAKKKAVHKKVAQKKGAKSSVSKRATAHARRSIQVSRVSAAPTTLAHPGLQSGSALVMNGLTGEIIYAKHPDTLTPIASITKLMTAMVVLDAQQPLSELISISHDDIDTLKGTRSRLTPGLTLTRGEMLLLALMSSENRAASALARHYPGGRDAFIAKMNEKAASLGMKSTRFLDSTGLNPGNVSTPRELALMVQAAHRYSTIQQYSTSVEYSFISNMNKRPLVFHNTNPLVKSDKWEIGVSKTGYISEAGRCLVMQTTIGNAPVVMVLMDSNGKNTRVGDASRIRKWLEAHSTSKTREG